MTLLDSNKFGPYTVSDIKVQYVQGPERLTFDEPETHISSAPPTVPAEAVPVTGTASDGVDAHTDNATGLVDTVLVPSAPDRAGDETTDPDAEAYALLESIRSVTPQGRQTTADEATKSETLHENGSASGETAETLPSPLPSSSSSKDLMPDRGFVFGGTAVRTKYEPSSTVSKQTAMIADKLATTLARLLDARRTLRQGPTSGVDEDDQGRPMAYVEATVVSARDLPAMKKIKASTCTSAH